MKNIGKNYEIAKDLYASYGVDTDLALSIMDKVPISVHCWQIDDLSGFENPDGPMTGGIMATGNAAGKPSSQEAFFSQLANALSLVPGRKKIAAHAIYLNNDGKSVDRDALEPEHFSHWVDFAREQKIGLDFNPTYFSHPKSENGFTLSSADEGIRRFWVEHGKRCRKIGEYFGREMGETCYTNHWIPDGYKDINVDSFSPRARLIQSLNEIFEEPIDPKYNVDSLESKLFGVGVESYTTGSHDFYTNYCSATKKAIICLDSGHYHPTESVAAKLSAYLVFGQEIMLHVSRPVRWDSDHVVLLDEETRHIMEEIVRCGATDKVHIGLDYFDGSINRIAATAIGARNAKKALLLALLEPTDRLRECEYSGNYTKRLALLEEIKTLPFGFVWDQYCEMHQCAGDEWVKSL